MNPLSSFRAPFKIGTTSMVFGDNLVDNVDLLADLMDHIEIVLFYTPDLHNIPEASELNYLKRIGEHKHITYSVHLPAFLEVASSDDNIQAQSIQLAGDIIVRMNALRPRHHIIHIPFTAPTLTPEPDVYFSNEDEKQFYFWTPRALNSLQLLKNTAGQGTKILVENINYSPSFLKPFLRDGLCDLCLDLGHLLLGRERVVDTLNTYLKVTREIHLHGVVGYEEHLSLAVLPIERISKWIRLLWQSQFSGIVILEVFTPGDLEESLELLSKTFCSLTQ